MSSSSVSVTVSAAYSAPALRCLYSKAQYCIVLYCTVQYSTVPVQQRGDLQVLVVLAEGVIHRLRGLQPACSWAQGYLVQLVDTWRGKH